MKSKLVLDLYIDKLERPVLKEFENIFNNILDISLYFLLVTVSVL